MSEKRDDGGPAFPTEDFRPFPGGGGQHVRLGGMSLRDWLAGQAMGCTLTAFITRGEGPEAVSELETLAMRAYQMADAMLAERSR